MGTDLDPIGLVSLAAVAVAAGLVGCFAVVRRMSLAADALSHVALPGIGIAIALHLHPLIGAVAMLVFGALLVWGLEETTRAGTEMIIGVVFSAALAVGGLVTSGDDLVDALFGRPGPASVTEAVVAVAAAAAIVFFIVRAKDRLVVALISPDIARTVGIDVRRLNLAFLMVFALTIALGLRYLGVLLMGSLIIIPAATAKRVSRNLRHMLTVAAVVAVVSSLGGELTAAALHREPGPLVVAFATVAFLLGGFIPDSSLDRAGDTSAPGRADRGGAGSLS
jgi:ABC-type Mn2+/Zn2+ transport system permease subunit